MTKYVKMDKQFKYGDNPVDALGKFDHGGRVIDEVLYTNTKGRNCVEIHYSGKGQYWFTHAEGDLPFNLYEKDNRVYLTLKDINPTLIGKKIKCNEETITVASIKVSSDKIAAIYCGSDTAGYTYRYIGVATVGDWFFVD